MVRSGGEGSGAKANTEREEEWGRNQREKKGGRNQIEDEGGRNQRGKEGETNQVMRRNEKEEACMLELGEAEDHFELSEGIRSN